MFFGLAILLVIVGYQAPVLYQQKRYRELAAFMGFWVVSAVYSLLIVMDISLISPFEIITIIIKQLYKMI